MRIRADIRFSYPSLAVFKKHSCVCKPMKVKTKHIGYICTNPISTHTNTDNKCIKTLVHFYALLRHKVRLEAKEHPQTGTRTCLSYRVHTHPMAPGRTKRITTYKTNDHVCNSRQVVIRIQEQFCICVCTLNG